MAHYGIGVAILSVLFVLTACDEKIICPQQTTNLPFDPSCNLTSKCGFTSSGGEACNNNRMWISNKDGGISEGAVLVGYDHHGVDMYLARVSCGNNIFPAKLIGFLKTAHVAYGNKEICVRKYEVFCNTVIAWKEVRNCSTLPPNAIVVGYTEENDLVFVGRARVEDTLTVGTILRRTKQLVVPLDHIVHRFSTYEIMVYPGHYSPPCEDEARL